jgi:fructose-1,6-bisphosphatase/inositol monophosphatase family enzyme
MRSLDDYLRVAVEAAERAGEYLLERFGGIKEIEHVSGTQYRIDEDEECNEVYIDYLKGKSPEMGLYLEGGEQSLEEELVWVVDAIEGTSNYRVGNPFWATQICLLKEKEPVVAVVNAPKLNQMFTAKKRGGVYLNGKKVKCSGEMVVGRALISVGKGTKRSDLEWYGKVVPRVVKKVRTFRHYGACGLEIAHTAAGMIDGYVNSGSYLYDYVPGVLLVKEAGGVVWNKEGKPWGVEDDYLVASNKILAGKILSLVES